MAATLSIGSGAQLEGEYRRIHWLARSSGEVPEGPLVRTWREARYAEPGYLLFLQGSTLMARRFDPARLRFTGEPTALPEQIGQNSGGTGRAMFSTSATGTLVYQEAFRTGSPRRFAKPNRRPASNYRSASGQLWPSLDPRGRNVVVFGDGQEQGCTNSGGSIWREAFPRP